MHVLRMHDDLNVAYLHFAQVLLTSNDLRHRHSQSGLLNTVNALLSMKVVPVLNGNDVVAPTPEKDLDLKNVSLELVLMLAQSK